MARKSHPHKEIEKALKYAEAKGWAIKVGAAHAWGRMYCPYNSQACRNGQFCLFSINSTPRDPYRHAKMIRKIADKCTGEETEN